MSDHIPDLTKMISNTPRTDRWLKNINGWHYVEVERSRELERELNAANQRIKRLEEAGDAMATYAHIIDFKNWKEAKEAKP